MLGLLLDAWTDLLALPHAAAFIAIAWLVYLLGLGGWIVLQKREPVATISWLLGLALLPWIGFIVYQWLGPQRIRRHRLRRARSRSARVVPVEEGDEDIARELAHLGVATTGLPTTTAREVRLLVDGAAKYTALLADVARARESIDLEYYIFQPDHTGTALRDALAERQRAGVRVRLLLDAVGSAKCPRRFFAPLLAAGGELAWFHPMRFGRIWQRPWLNLRTHRKIVVIDGAIAYTGGINITDEEDERLRPDAYRDLHLRLDGDVARALQIAFVEDWSYATGTPPVLPPMPGPRPGSHPVQVLTSGPDSPWEPIHRLHVAAIHGARRRVWLTTPYFVPGEAAMMALTSAALAGLDVRLLVPRRGDSRVVTYAARSYFDDLLAAGVRVYEYGPRLMHSKSLLVDDHLAIIGSANFDHRSFRLNFELSLLFHDVGIAAELERVIEADFAQAPRVRADRPQPLWRARLPEALARLVSPLL